jgi:hypothetical protein
MQHMFEAIRQTFSWVKHFGTEEYTGNEAKHNALLWINAALLFHDLGEIAIIKGTNLPLWYHFTFEWTKKRRKNIIRETYPFFGVDSPEGRSYINHLKHPVISAALAADPLFRLGWDSGAIKVVQLLIRNHSTLIEQATYGRPKDGRVLHEDLYKEIVAVHEETGIAGGDILKMLQVVQMMDAKAVKPDMAQIPQETLMRVWMAYNYMNIVLTARSSTQRYQAFNNYRKVFNQVRKELPFGTPFNELFKEVVDQIEAKDGPLDKKDRDLLEQELECFEIFEITREDHIHINNQFNQLLHLIERRAGTRLSAKDTAVLLQAYKIAYRSHDGQFRRAHKIIPTGDKRRKYIEHPIRVAKIMVNFFGITDSLTLAAALFHDVLEDTDINVDDILAAFKNDDERGNIISAVTLLTKPESRNALKGKLHKDLAYLTYMANIFSAGDKVLDDLELFEWLRFVIPRTKAADKIHNRRTLMARKPEGRIKEICRNGNTLVMFMEASNLSKEEKLKILNEFDKSFLEIFNLLDFKRDENAEIFQKSLLVFRQTVREHFAEVDENHAGKQNAIKDFESAVQALPQHLGNPDSIVEKLKDIENALPHFCRQIGLGKRESPAVIDGFALFLFNISEVKWITDEGKRKIIEFQKVVRRYKQNLQEGAWEPGLARTIENLARYAQGYRNVSPPIVRFGLLPDISELLSKVPLIHHWYDPALAKKKRKRVARLLPRVAMLPLKQIYWLEGNEIRSADRAMVESEIGGLSVGNTSGRIVIRMHPSLLWHRLKNSTAKISRPE